VSNILEHIALLVLTRTPTGPGAAEAAGAASSVKIESVWDFVAKGGVMMIPIGICSLIGMTVVIERLLSLRRSRIIPPTFLPGLRRELDAKPGDPAGAITYCAENPSPVANVFAAGLRRLGGPLEIVERHITESGMREVRKLRKHLRMLSVIAAVTPLMGLLGTIFGMIRAFQTVATSPDAMGKTELLAEGIYEAMITTAAGLVVAIPALICYHWLSAKIQNLVMDIDDTTVDFVESLAAGGTGAGAPTGSERPAVIEIESPPTIAAGDPAPA